MKEIIWIIGGMILLSVLGSCQCQYFLIRQMKTWGAAQNYCREAYTDLATVENMADIDRLIQSAGSGYIGTVWMGLYDRATWDDWTWPEGHLYQEGNYTTRWDPVEPAWQRYWWEICGAILNGFWCSSNCSVARNFVCYEQKNSTLPKKFYFINEFMSWHEAQDYCRQQYTDLASVKITSEDDEIRNIVPIDTMTFVGLRKLTWYWWSDGSEHNFTYWFPNRPAWNTGNCATSRISSSDYGKFSDSDCNTAKHFVCSRAPKKIYHIRLKVQNSTVNLDDPNVTEAILTQIKQRMTANGVKHFNITWTKPPGMEIFHKDLNV